MKFLNIYRTLVLEQQVVNPDDEDQENIPQPHGFAPNPEDPEIEPEDDEGLEDNPEMDRLQQNIVARQEREKNEPDKQKTISRAQQIKNKWKEESPAATDNQIIIVIDFFNQRKNRLKPYKPYGTIDPQTGRYYVNLPEVTALLEKFPDMESTLSNEAKMKDMGSYTWEQMTFWMNRYIQQAIELDDENYVKGDYTEDQRIKIALERWSKPYNRIIADGTLIVYRVECQSEAIALGSLDHAIFRKYTTPKGKQSISPDVHEKALADVSSYTIATQPWCISRAHGGPYGDSLWTNYRPANAFYFVLDNSRPEWNQYHLTALQPQQYGGYDLSTLYNNTESHRAWSGLVAIYPGLRGKEQLFPWFGITPRERKELTFESITFTKGDPSDFAVQPEAIQKAYIENNRYVRDVRCFLTLSKDLRKLYIDKTTKINNDYKQRFLCENPPDEPLGILDILKNERIDKEDLYKYLDFKILKTNLGIPEGILAIKMAILGNDWRRFLTDIETANTLCTTRDVRTRFNRTPKYGIINLNTFELVKDMSYVEGRPQSFVHVYSDNNGVKQKKIYIFQRYSRSVNGLLDNDDYFYFLYLKDALANKNSEFYMKGKYYDGDEGDNFIKAQVESRNFIRI